ncbi:MAG: family 10 glycosylhydrolase, partial [Bacteroidota bacterium]
MKQILLIAASWFLITLGWTQTDVPDREFRAAWVATVKGIDWPTKQGMTSLEQQEELLAILDTLQNKGLNAIIFQVRPASDAFYRSNFEPWSEWLTGQQGKAPAPYYDPLAFAIEACHDRGMELHAWFNPFRALTDWERNKQIHPDHVTMQHPEWILTYGKNQYIDPGIPAARQFVKSVILECCLTTS